MLLHDDNDSYRYERKFHLETLSRTAVESLVLTHPTFFSEIYHQRWVNNAYLDTWSRDSYTANVDGRAHDRVKVRLRWYGAAETVVEQPVLELKIKQGLVNCKRSYRLPAWNLLEQGSSAGIIQLLQNAELPQRLQQSLRNLELALCNRYLRTYYLSACGNFRITIDSELAYGATLNDFQRNTNEHLDTRSVIVELKYLPKDDSRARFLTQSFPFRLSRSSKYVMGIDWLAAHHRSAATRSRREASATSTLTKNGKPMNIKSDSTAVACLAASRRYHRREFL